MSTRKGGAGGAAAIEIALKFKETKVCVFLLKCFLLLDVIMLDDERGERKCHNMSHIVCI